MALIKKKGFGFKRIKNEYKLVKANVPLKLANEVQNHFLIGFRRGGGQTDKSIGGWPKRKTSRNVRERKRSKGRALLVRSGKMRADIKKRKVSFSKVIVGTRSIPYAGFINDGTSKMPQREFIGDSKILEKKIQNKINKEVMKIFK